MSETQGATDAGGGNAEGNAAGTSTQEGDAGSKVVPEGSQVSPPLAPKPRVRLKDGDEEIEVDEDELQKGFLEGRRTAKEHKQLREAIELARANPDLFFQHTGIDPTQYSQAHLLKKMENDLLTKDERDLRDFRAAEEKRLAKEAEDEANAARARQEELYQSVGNTIQADIKAALKANGLKPTPKNIARVAEVMEASVMAGRSMPADEAMRRVDKSLSVEVADHLVSKGGAYIQKDYPELYQLVLDHAASGSSTSVPTLAQGVAPEKQDRVRKPKALPLDDYFKSI